MQITESKGVYVYESYIGWNVEPFNWKRIRRLEMYLSL